MATTKKKTNDQPEAIEPYRARARREITVAPGFVIPEGNIFETDQIPFDAKSMEIVG